MTSSAATPLMIHRRPSAGALVRGYTGRAGPGFVVGVVLILTLLAIGLIAPLLLGSALATNSANVFAAPGGEHLLGTDRYGRDILSRAVSAIRIDLALGVGIAVAALVIGSLIGVASAYFGGLLDEIVMRGTDVVMAFPGFVFALMLAAFTGGNLFWAAIGVVIGATPNFVRLTRARALAERSKEYVAAARVSGTPHLVVVVRHILPNSIPPAFVQGTITAGWAMLDIAALSFLGLGVQPPTPEWGAMISEGYGDMVTGVWWTAVFPGLFLLTSVLSFQLIGDGMDRAVKR